MSTLSSDAILAYETAVARLILVTIVEATPVVGRPPSRSFVAAALVGSLRRDLVAVDGHRLSTFGVLAKQGIDAVYEWLDTLVAGAYVEVTTGRRGLVCTGDGRRLVDGEAPYRPIGLLVGAVSSAELDLAVRSGLVEALRRYRAEHAAKDEVPEYRLFTEATLREIAARRPQNESALEQIPGLGEKKIPVHGIEILRIVAEHEPIIERLRQDRPRAGDLLDDPLATTAGW